MAIKHYDKGFPPVCDGNSRVLLLGTHPSDDSLDKGFYYSGSRNRFWKTISQVFGVPEPKDKKSKEKFCLEHNIALWDVLKACDRDGAKDATIKNPEYNDFVEFFKDKNISHVFCLGKDAYKFYCEYRDSKNRSIIEAVYLVSSSNAARKINDDELVILYREELKKVPGFESL